MEDSREMTEDMNHTQNRSGLAIEVLLVCAHSAEEDCYYAWSPQLRCVRDGQTPDEALESCMEALDILFESLLERDTLHGHLAAHGYAPLAII
jgi:predicted RNase H-like HicB family nuclease